MAVVVVVVIVCRLISCQIDFFVFLSFLTLLLLLLLLLPLLLLLLLLLFDVCRVATRCREFMSLLSTCLPVSLVLYLLLFPWSSKEKQINYWVSQKKCGVWRNVTAHPIVVN